MERLTKTYSNGTHGAADNLPCGENSYQYKGLLLEALGKYEDAEEQGLLLRLPCKVGDTVYVNNGFTIFEYEVTLTGYSSTSKESGFYFVTKPKKNSDTVQEFSDGDFGKTVFLTREEAEAKLKETEDANVHECD